MTPERGKQALWTALGVSAGVAAGVWIWRRRGRQEPAPHRRWSRPEGTGSEVAEALRRDRTLARRDIEVDAIADGVIELTGSVQTRSEAQRAVSIVQGRRGIYTVVNRLVVEEEESQREETRRRRAEGAPELQERGHHGMGVGMGTRRQSPDTDPDRPSDRQKMLDRELEVQNVVDAPEAGPDPVSGAEAVESGRVKPRDEEHIREAGLDPEPRPTSTPRESVGGEPGATPSEEAVGAEAGEADGADAVEPDAAEAGEVPPEEEEARA